MILESKLSNTSHWPISSHHELDRAKDLSEMPAPQNSAPAYSRGKGTMEKGPWEWQAHLAQNVKHWPTETVCLRGF